MTDREGRFQIVVPAGPGHLLVRAATPDYLHLTTNNLGAGPERLPIWLMYPDALAHIDLKPDETSHEVTMRLRRGVTVAGELSGLTAHPLPGRSLSAGAMSLTGGTGLSLGGIQGHRTPDQVARRPV